jgi:hypothetical protein
MRTRTPLWNRISGSGSRGDTSFVSSPRLASVQITTVVSRLPVHRRVQDLALARGWPRDAIRSWTRTVFQLERMTQACASVPPSSTTPEMLTAASARELACVLGVEDAIEGQVERVQELTRRY